MVIVEILVRLWFCLFIDLFEYRGGYYFFCFDYYLWRSLFVYLFYLSDSVLIRIDFCVKIW